MTTTAASLLVVDGVSKSFGGLAALKEVRLKVEQGRIVGLIGPNGSGKSTLFDIISGFQRADRGRILYRGSPIGGMAPHRIASRGLVRTFQMSEGGQQLTAIENLLAAATGQNEHDLVSAVIGIRSLMKRERANLARAGEVLRMLGLEHVKNEYLGNLSGGQKKLIDLGRVFMVDPMLALLDEPTAGVNPTLINVILDTLKRLNRDYAIGLFIVEHNMQVIREVCDYVYVLDAGSLICEGTPDAVQADERVLEIYLGRTRAAAEP
ncbi:MAG: ABC transporter ATP-binding protein [Alphaproteobacteria bacterium]|nr:ABC transporter ATP-binding protein [Alphaproteobacteria bacterium]